MQDLRRFICPLHVKNRRYNDLNDARLSVFLHNKQASETVCKTNFRMPFFCKTKFVAMGSAVQLLLVLKKV